MPFNPKSKANLIPYKPGKSGNPNGRPRKILSVVNADLIKQGYTPVMSAHVIEAYNILLNLPEERIKEIITSADSPMFFRVVAKALLSKDGPDMIERILDRAHGKAIQSAKVEHSGEIGSKVLQVEIIPPVKIDED